MPKLVDSVIAVAKSQVGVHEGRSAGHWNNDQKYSNEVPGLAWSDFQPWCATFVSWVALKAGVAELYPSTASCDLGGAWFKKRGRWSEYPAIGAQVFFGSTRDLNHTGVVYDYDDTYVYTIEGNTNLTGSREGDGVYLKRRVRRDANLVGYGYPKFPEGIKSADPAWAGDVKVTVPAPVTPAPPAPPKHAAGTARIDLVDLSHHNVGVTLSALQKAKAGGVKGVYHKATEGHRFVDSQYAVRRRLAAKVDLPFGGYHFARPKISSGTVQAQDFLKVASPKPGDLVPVLDLEDRGGLSDADLTRWVRQWCTEVERQLGVKGLIYTPFDLADTFGWRLWVARYSDAMKAPRIPKPWAAWTVWQFSNGEFGKPSTVPGLGHCDINTLSWEPKPALTRLRIPKTRPAVVTPKPVPVPIKPKPAKFRNMTANVQHTDPEVQTTAEIGRLAQLADLIGWQEIETAAEVNALKALVGFEHFLPGGAANAVAISWRSDVFELITSESILVHRGLAHVTPNRYINVVVLEHKATGLWLTRINTHVLNGIERGGLPIANLIRRPKAKKHFTLLAGQLMRWKLPIIIGGDFNVNYFSEKRLTAEQRCSWFPLTALNKTTFVIPAVGTHGSRAIDWTCHVGPLQADVPFLAPVGFSDHRAVITEYTFTTKENHAG